MFHMEQCKFNQLDQYYGQNTDFSRLAKKVRVRVNGYAIGQACSCGLRHVVPETDLK